MEEIGDSARTEKIEKGGDNARREETVVEQRRWRREEKVLEQRRNETMLEHEHEGGKDSARVKKIV